MTHTILVLGATGFAGRQVVKNLSARPGVQVKAATRFPEKYKAPAANVSPVHLVQEDFSTFAPALSGVDLVFLSAVPLDMGSASKLRPFIDEAKKAQVKKIVFLSAMGVEHAEASPMRQIELHLIASGIPYNIVRPNFFMEVFSESHFSNTIRHLDKILIPAADGKYSVIAASDIAAVAAELLLNEAHNGRELTLTGPKAIDNHEAAAIISSVSGKNVTYENIPESVLVAEMLAAGASESDARFMSFLMGALRDGHFAPVSTAVKDITGREPLSFEAFAEANKTHFS
ncbi:NmrA family NAD(P)-binding protein [Chitinophaga rhizosphaerae]|uniref:NmrA family NAD(P)-binding protein n=1 Tax=Chitinophaga rhizosphaerae TaxID=1864947 RepID=UPI000F80C283|nr:NAD(P)H-binding protein [Chitinophaga rhizosphaerae]